MTKINKKEAGFDPYCFKNTLPSSPLKVNQHSIIIGI